jgi:glycosyltransferase involved in cell wall biosynthesis
MNSEYCIGIPARNEANNISGLLQSLLEQTVPPSRIIVCVNGTTDDTFEIASNIAEENPVVKVINSAPGKANAWHAIMDKVTTDKVMFCDGDVRMDKNAAATLLECLNADPSLIIAGGTAWSINEKKTAFARYFVGSEPEPPEPKWLIGRLYMFRRSMLEERARKLDIELMPRDIINDDGFLEMVCAPHVALTRKAFATSAGVDSFHDWRHRYIRILAGKLQLENRYGNLQINDGNENTEAEMPEENSKAAGARIKRVFNDLRLTYYETRHLDSVRERSGIILLAVVKIAINMYYKIVGGPYCATTWTEAKSTKKELTGDTQ